MGTDNRGGPARQDSFEQPGSMTVDEALDKIGLGRGQAFSISVMCLFWVSESMQSFIFFYLPSALRDTWGTGADAVAWVDASFFIGAFIGAIFGGWAADKFERKPTLLVAAAFSAVTGIACYWAMDFWYLSTMRFLVGLGNGAFAPASLTMTLETVPRKYRGQVAMAVAGFSEATGRLLAALLGLALYDEEYNPEYVRFGWKTTLLIATIPIIIALFLGLYVLGRSARWLLVKGKRQEASDALHALALKNGTADQFPKGTPLRTTEDDVALAGEYHDDTYSRMLEPPLSTVLLLCSLSHVLISIAYFGMIYALPVYLVSYGARNHWTEFEKDFVLVIVAGSEPVAIFVALWTIQLPGVGRRITTVACMVGASVFCVLFNFHVISTLTRNSYMLTVTHFFARGFAAVAILASNLYVGEIFPTRYRGQAVAIAMSTGRLGAALAPLITGFLLLDVPEMDLGMWSKLQPLRIYMLFAILSGLAAWLFSELGLETGNSSLPDHEGDLAEQMTDSEFGGTVGKVLHKETSPLIPRRRKESLGAPLDSKGSSGDLESPAA